MATEDRVVIHVEIEADTKEAAKVIAAIKAIEGAEKSMIRRTNTMGSGIDKVDRSSKKLSRTLSAVGNAFATLFRITNKLNFIGMAADIGLVSLSLLGVKAALVLGRFAVKAYQVALQGLGVAAAAAAAAIGTVAAAMNEFQQVSLMPVLGGFREAASAVRGVMGDSLLSFFGHEGLTGAMDALAQSGTVAAASFPSILRGLGNFARDGKQLAQLAEIFGTINKEGKVTASTFGSLTSINPVFASALAEISSGRVLEGEAANKLAASAAEAGSISAQEFGRVFTGELQSTDLWEGQLERLNNTLVGQIRGLVVRLGAMFTDLGKPFLEPLRESISDIERITTNMIIRIRGALTDFGLNSFLPGMVATFEALANFIVRMSTDALPKMEGIMGRIRGFFDSMENFFRNIGAVLGPLERGAEVMMSVFGPFLRGLFGAKGLGGLIMEAANGFEDNAESMAKMSQALGDFAFAFMGIFRDLQDSFFSGSDVIAEFFSVLAVDVMPVVREMLEVFRSIFREALPTVNTLLRETAQILLPILNLLNSLVGSFGGLGAAALFGLMGARKGGLPGPAMAGAGMGGAMGGLPGAIIGGLAFNSGSRMLGGAMAGGSARATSAGLGSFMRGGALGGGGRHLAAGAGRGAILSGPALALGAGIGFGGFAGGKALAGTSFGQSIGTAGIAGAGLLGGAAAGAGAGALAGAIGGPLAPLTVPVGLIIGGIVGAIGAALGSASYNETKKKAVMWIEEQMEAVTGEIGRSLEKGTNRRALKEAREIMEEMLDPKNVKSMAEQLKMTESETRTILEESTQKYEQEIQSREDTLETSLRRINEIFGMTEDQILELADIMAVDLSDSIQTFIQDLHDLELLIPFEEMAGAVRAIGEDNALTALFGPDSVLGRGIGKSQAAGMREEIDALLDTLKATEQAGDLGAIPQQISDILESVIAVGQLEYGEKGIELLFRAKDALGQIADPTASAYVGPESAQQASQVLAQDINPMIQSLEDGTHPIYGPLKATVAALGDPDITFDKIFEEQILPAVDAAGGFQHIENIMETISTDYSAFALAITGAGTEFSMDVVTSSNYLSATLQSAARQAAAHLGYAYASTRVPGGNNQTSSKSPSNPNNYPTYPAPGGDTATSRLDRVLGFHSQLSSKLGGGFNVTSGIRNFGLGSGSSDHLAGGAIDITGGNLGQYANAVNGMGGFAEFHGRGGSRHLHAVPPVGDTANPAQMGSAGGGGTMMNVTFEINGANDPTAVADEVMSKLQKVMRDEAERQ